uniref:Transport and golgi organization 6 homolog (Drosophila) n=1 Tax=Kryptolebias marmoratus TaxID=37003 RepID=A0A3Q2ZLE9_KRYMA
VLTELHQEAAVSGALIGGAEGLMKGSDQRSQQEALRAALGANRARLLQRLQSDSSLEAVRKLRDEVKLAADWFCSDTEDVTWSFVQECLLLLLTLTRHLTVELERFQQAPPPSAGKLRTPEMAPPLPPDVLSVSQQKTLGAALQFVVSLGLCPYLAPGVGLPLGRRSAFGAVVETLVRREASPPAGRRLLITSRVLLQLAELSSVATLVFTRHLGDVMAALCQLGHQPHRDADRVKNFLLLSFKALRSLLGKVYQPIVIKELLILQGGPKQVAGLGSAPAWLRRLCGQLLSERLMQPNGVQAVVRAVLEGGTAHSAGGGDSDWRKCDAVARILSACPQQSASAEDYFKLVCPQVVDLLHFQDKQTALQFQRVATRAALSMVQERPGLAQRYLLGPLLSPLQRCTDEKGFGGDFIYSSFVVFCLRCRQIWVVGASPSAALLATLEDVLPVVFTLFCFTKQNVCHLRAPCQQILLWFLNHSEPPAALSALRRLSGLQERRNDVAADLQFSAGSDGGVRLVCRQSCSDEDDQLYEKLSGEQWRLESLMQLLAELKDSDLPGDFFLDLLKEMRKGEEQVDVAAMTLLEAEHRLVGGAERRAQRLALLQVVAVMVECRRTSLQVVDFMVSLLQRACVGLDVSSGSGVGNPVETQTLSLGMGLIATLLSAPQVQKRILQLLPHLQMLSLLHPDPMVQELASNLRAVIATHGAYRPEDLAAAGAGQSSRNPETISQTPVSSNSRHAEPSQPSPKGDSDSSNKTFSDWLLEACDPDVPTRAFALRILTQKVQRRDTEAVQAQENLLLLLLENLEHEDPFVYLSAIQGNGSATPSLLSSDRERSLETRLKVGEVLMRTRELAPHLGRPLVGVFLQGTRDPDQSVRASSLSNLGEICQKLDFSLGALAHVLLSETCPPVLSEVLLDLYRALKWVVRSDPDEVAVLHAQLALEELDDVMRRFIFPEQKLEKKIVVLS